MTAVRAAIVFFGLFAGTLSCLAEDGACALRIMSETAEPVYPPIAKAAQVAGNVIMQASFKTTGEVENVDVISGPMMLRSPAVTYVQSWRANEYTGPRTCPIVINFVLIDETAKQPVVRNDSQHVTVYGQAPCLCDPPATLGKRRRWYWPF